MNFIFLVIFLNKAFIENFIFFLKKIKKITFFKIFKN